MGRELLWISCPIEDGHNGRGATPITVRARATCAYTRAPDRPDPIRRRCGDLWRAG